MPMEVLVASMVLIGLLAVSFTSHRASSWQAETQNCVGNEEPLTVYEPVIYEPVAY